MAGNLSGILRGLHHSRGGKEGHRTEEPRRVIIDKFPDKDATALFWPVTSAYVLTRQVDGNKYLFYRGKEEWVFEVCAYEEEVVDSEVVSSMIETREMYPQEAIRFVQACEERLKTGGEKLEARDEFEMLLNAAWEAASELLPKA